MIAKAAQLILAVALLAPGGMASAEGDGDWREGRKVFKKCSACHGLRPGQARFGPSLAGVFGRKAGHGTDYPYSDAMKAKGVTGLVWSEDTIDDFIAAPTKFVPGTKMAFPGLPDAADRRNVIAYVKRKAKP